jgi:glycosyltransferase involved in cell wall biosynthesis
MLARSGVQLAGIWFGSLQFQHLAAHLSDYGEPSTVDVLMMAYYFPPDPTVGALRTRRFARHLPEFGWRATVVTKETPGLRGVKSSSNGDWAPAVLQASTLPGFRSAVLAAAAPVRLLRGKPAVGQADALPGEYVPPNPDSLSGMRRSAYALMWLPDDKHGWILPAVAAALRGVRRCRADVILSSGPPWSSHLAALIVAKLTRLPLVTDYRDPWIGSLVKPPAVTTSWSDHVERAMERTVVRTSALTVCTTEGLRREMLKRYPGLDHDKVVAIPNGYDHDDLAGLPTCQPHFSDVERPVELAFVGSLYAQRDPTPLLRAAAELRRAGAPPFRFVFMGECRSIGGVSLPQLAQQLGLGDAVCFTGQLPRHDCLARLAQADVGLAFSTGEAWQVPAKVFEYMALRKPILALADRGSAMWELIASTQAGVAVEASDSRGLTDALMAAITRQLTPCDQSVLAQYDGRALTGRLADSLNAAVAGRGASR